MVNLEKYHTKKPKCDTEKGFKFNKDECLCLKKKTTLKLKRKLKLVDSHKTTQKKKSASPKMQTIIDIPRDDAIDNIILKTLQSKVKSKSPPAPKPAAPKPAPPKPAAPPPPYGFVPKSQFYKDIDKQKTPSPAKKSSVKKSSVKKKNQNKTRKRCSKGTMINKITGRCSYI